MANVNPYTAQMLMNAKAWMASQPPSQIGPFQSFMMPMIRSAFPTNLINGTGIKYDDKSELDLSKFDFEPVFEDLKNASTMKEVAATLTKYNCNKPGVVQIFIDLGAISCVDKESDMYSEGGILSVQPMTKPSSLVYALRYRYAKKTKSLPKRLRNKRKKR